MRKELGSYIFSEFGGPEALTWVPLNVPTPEEDQLLIRHEAIGVNYIDIYHRTGKFAAPLPLPSSLGMEGAGVVEVVGSNVKGFESGDRIVYAGGPPGAYSDIRTVPAARAVKIPDRITSEVAAALFFKSLTAEYLIRRCYSVKPGDVVLVHAAAGGVGRILCQWLAHLGAEVIGTVSSDQKTKIAKANGCVHAIVYSQEDFVESVRDITDGVGVDVVYDSVGKDTFMGSLDCVKTRGTLVSFGAASGPVPPFDIAQLGAKGSIFLTRPSIAHYTASRHDLQTAADSVFEMIERGVIGAGSITRYGLHDAVQAHIDLENRKTTGSLLLIP